MTELNSRASVAIVGGGLAGLAARQHLAAAGAPVDCFDKGRGPGGRMSRRSAGDYQFDHGAQYFTARSTEFSEIVARWIADGSVQRWQPRIGVLQGGLWTAKATATDRYVGVPGMNRPAKTLAASGDAAGAAPMRLSTRIVSLQREGDGQWLLIDEGDARYGPYDTVIVAVPPAQALELVAPSSQSAATEGLIGGYDVTEGLIGGYDVTEGLDRIRPVLDGIVVDPCWAVMAVFDRALPLDWDAAFLNTGPLTWVARNSSKPGRPASDAWVLHAGSEWSRRHLEDTAEEVTSRLIEEFRSAAGLGTVRPVWSSAHRWRYARPRHKGVLPGTGVSGTVANREAPFLWDETSHVGFCGDWLSGGRVEGAFLSGRSLAAHVAAVVP